MEAEIQNSGAIMRRTLALVIASFLPTFAGFAHADTLSFTPAGGTTQTFAIDPANPSSSVSGSYFVYYPVTSSSTGDQFELLFPSQSLIATYIAAGYNFGPIDFSFLDVTTGASGYFDGIPLYSGDESSPTFVNGTIDLLNDPYFNNGDASFSYQPDTALTPEPASITLLLTGLFACAGLALRRRSEFSWRDRP